MLLLLASLTPANSEGNNSLEMQLEGAPEDGLYGETLTFRLIVRAKVPANVTLRVEFTPEHAAKVVTLEGHEGWMVLSGNTNSSFNIRIKISEEAYDNLTIKFILENNITSPPLLEKRISILSSRRIYYNITKALAGREVEVNITCGAPSRSIPPIRGKVGSNGVLEQPVKLPALPPGTRCNLTAFLRTDTFLFLVNRTTNRPLEELVNATLVPGYLVNLTVSPSPPAANLVAEAQVKVGPKSFSEQLEGGLLLGPPERGVAEVNITFFVNCGRKNFSLQVYTLRLNSSGIYNSSDKLIHRLPDRSIYPVNITCLLYTSPSPRD